MKPKAEETRLDRFRLSRWRLAIALQRALTGSEVSGDVRRLNRRLPEEVERLDMRRHRQSREVVAGRTEGLRAMISMALRRLVHGCGVDEENERVGRLVVGTIGSAWAPALVSAGVRSEVP